MTCPDCRREVAEYDSSGRRVRGVCEAARHDRVAQQPTWAVAECRLLKLAAEAAEARGRALGEAADAAHRSQTGCFCAQRPDIPTPCAACVEAARIEGAIRGLRDGAP